MTRNQIFGRRVKIARAALNLSLDQFAAKTGLSANTISRIENGGATLSDTRDAIEDTLKNTAGLDCFRDDGKSIGVRVNYDKLSTVVDDLTVVPKLREFKKSKGQKIFAPDPEPFEDDPNQTDFARTLKRLDRQAIRQREVWREQNTHRDKRVGKRHKGTGAFLVHGVDVIPADKHVKIKLVPTSTASERLYYGESPITVWREQYQMTLPNLASKVGITTRRLREVEDGLGRPASLKVRRSLARALNIELGDLIPKVAPTAEMRLAVIQRGEALNKRGKKLKS